MMLRDACQWTAEFLGISYRNMIGLVAAYLTALGLAIGITAFLMGALDEGWDFVILATGFLASGGILSEQYVTKSSL